MATCSKDDAWWPGSWPTRSATSATVNPAGMERGKTLGPALTTESTRPKLLFLLKAYAPDSTPGAPWTWLQIR